MAVIPVPWTFYGFFPAPAEADSSYESQMRPLGKVATVEQFWQVYSHLIRPADLPNFAALHFFKGDSRAMREDPEHQNGGSFLIRVSRQASSFYWERLITGLVVGQFNPSVLGAVISARQGHFKLLIWYSNAQDIELRRQICREICEIVKLPVGIRLDCTAHNTIVKLSEHGDRAIHFILEGGGPVETRIINKYRGSGAQGKDEGEVDSVIDK
jgi:translation initiation factor 4E